MVDITKSFNDIIDNINNNNKIKVNNKGKNIINDPIIDMSKTVLNKIIILSDFLKEKSNFYDTHNPVNNNRNSKYNNDDEFYNSYNDILTDDDRDVIDIEVHAAITDISKRIDFIRSKLPNIKANECSSLAHKQGIVVCLLGKVQDINEFVKNQQIIRQKYILQGSDRESSMCRPDMIADIQPISVSKSKNNSSETEEIIDDEKGNTNEKNTSESQKLFKSNNKAKSKLKSSIVDEEMKKKLENELDSEMIKIFEQEHVDLQNQLSNELEEAREIEKKMVNISHLVSFLSEKVVEQREAIDTIFTEAKDNVSTVEQVPDELVQANERNNAYKRYVIMFLLFMSFSLLFLDFVD